MESNKTVQYVLIAIALIVALVGSYFGISLPAPDIPEPGTLSRAAAYNVPCYIEQGGTAFQCDTGGGFVVGPGGTFTMEGATDDAYETVLAITDPTADRTITIPNSSGTIALNPAAGSIEFEGTTADDYETTLAVVDPTADRTVTIPNETAAVMVSSLATNGTDIANSVTGASNGLRFEGATANDFEATVSATDPTADRSIVIPDAGGTVMLSSLATNGADAANAVTGASNALVFEGATANDYETSIAPTDPTADRTVTLPNATGTVLLGSGVTTMVMGATTITATGAVTHGLTTPLYCVATMADDPVDDQEDRVTCVVAGATVTVKVWKEAATPTAGDSGVVVNWIVGGTP